MLEASIAVENTGSRSGCTVVQFYMTDPQARVARPDKELKGFVKLRLAPGETRTATVRLGMRDLAFFDTAGRRWTAEAGAFVVLAGVSSDAIGSMAHLILSGDWMGPPTHPPSPANGPPA